jgi:4-aminobutyrate aminotransferase
MAALIAREGLDVAGERALGHYTHEKSPVGCAAALATLDVIETGDLLSRARNLGERALSRLRALKSSAVLDVRGIGLLLAIELEDADLAEAVLYRSLERGLSFKIGQGRVIVLAPPLIIQEQDLDRALDIVEAAIAA